MKSIFSFYLGWFYGLYRSQYLRFSEKYYGLSPMQFAGNNPITNIEINGDSIAVMTGGVVYRYGFTQGGGYGFYDNSGSIYSGNDAYVQAVSGSLAKLGLGKEGRALINVLSSTTTDIEVKNTTGGNKAVISGKTRAIEWSPNNLTGGPDESGSTTRPIAIGLGHEMAHIEDATNGTYKQGDWINDASQSVVVPNAEIYSTHRENQLRAEQGLPLRTDYVPNYSGSKILNIKKRMSLYYDSNGKSIFNLQNNTYKQVPKKSSPFKY